MFARKAYFFVFAFALQLCSCQWIESTLDLEVGTFAFNPFTVSDYEQPLEEILSPVKLRVTNRSKTSAKELGITLTENSVRGKDNKAYNLYPYKNALHFELVDRLSDPEKALNIYNAIDKWLLQSQLSDPRKAFIIRFLANRAWFLGTKSNYLIPQLKQKMLREPIFLPAAEWSGIESIVDNLLRDISQAEKRDYVPDPNSNTIVILTVSTGGGHLSAALALQQELLASTKYKVELINLEEYTKENDPLMRLSGMSSGDIYNKFSQKQGNEIKAQRYWALGRLIHNFMPETSNVALRRDIKRLKPFVILNTAVYTEKYVSLSYSYDIPQMLVTTDYDIWPQLDPIVVFGNGQISKISLTSNYGSVFVSLQERTQGGKLQIAKFGNSRSRLNLSEEAIDPGIVNLFDLLKAEEKIDFNALKKAPIFYLLGYPVNSAFSAKSEAEIASDRSSRGIKPGEKAVLISMGSQGKPSIFTVLDSMLSDKAIMAQIGKVYVARGRNEELATKIRSHLKSLNTPETQKVELLSYQTPTNMNDLYNACDLIVSKPGGSTTAEVFHLRKPIVMYDLNFGEKHNAEIVADSGLGTLADDEDELADQIKAGLQKKGVLWGDFLPLDWKTNLHEYVDYVKKNPL